MRSSTRSSLTCTGKGMSASSSKKMVPPSARASRPEQTVIEEMEERPLATVAGVFVAGVLFGVLLGGRR